MLSLDIQHRHDLEPAKHHDAGHEVAKAWLKPDPASEDAHGKEWKPMH